MNEFLTKLGPGAKNRPAPTLQGAVAAAAGVLAFTGFAAIGIDDYAAEQSKPIAIILGLLAVAAGYGIMLGLAAKARPAGVVLATLGTPMVALVIFDDISSPGVVLLVLTLAWGAQYVFGPGRGHLPFLVGSLGALWLLLLDGAAPDAGSSSVDSEAFFVSPTPIASGDDVVTYLSLAVGLLLLFGARKLDSDGWHGVATGVVIVGDLAFVLGVFGVVGDLGSDVVGSILVIGAGAVLAVVGASGGRRLTTWLGGIGVLAGLIALLSNVFDPDDALQYGVAAVIIGAIVIYGVTVIDADMISSMRGTNSSDTDQPTPGAAWDDMETPTTTDDDADESSASTADWHPDPHGRHQMRWWDGRSWTDQVSDDGTASTDPKGS